MNKRSIIFVLLMAMGSMAVQAQINACPSFHNPTNFNVAVGGAGYWSARVGDRVEGSGGSTGSNVLSTCSRPNKPAIIGHANITNPQYYSGYCEYAACCGYNFYDLHDHRFQIYTQAENGGFDELTVHNGVGMQRIPAGHTSSIRLGDPRTTGTCVSNINTDGNNKGSEALFYTMMVTPLNALLFIDYAIVARRYDHSPREAGEFIIRVCGKSSNGQWNNFPLTDSLWYNVPAPANTGTLPAPWLEGVPGSSCSATTCGYCYKPWARVAINLIDYLFDSVRVEMYTSDCIYNVDPIYAYIAGDCQPMQITSSGCPAGESTAVDTLHAPEGMLSYTWYVTTEGYNGNIGSSITMDGLTYRQVQATSTNPTYVARVADFVVTQGAHAGDTVATQTYKCVMTSALDPNKPFHSKLYCQVNNTKPVINAVINSDCSGNINLEAMGKVPYQGSGATHLVDSLTMWEIFDGSNANMPILDTVYGKISSYKAPTSGTYAIRLTMFTDDSSCNTSKVFVQEVNLPPDGKLSIDKRTLCVGDMATITDLTTGNTSRRWEFADTTYDSQVMGMDNTRIIVRNFTEFENPFMLIVANNAGCIDTVYDTIYFFHDPEVNFSSDTIVCNGHESHVTASTPVEGCTFAWYKHKNRSGESPISVGPTLHVRPTQKTTYYVKLTSPAGCEAWDSVTLSFISTKITANPTHAKHCPGDSVTLTGSGALWYEWYSDPYDPDLAAQDHNRSITVSPKQDTRYYMIGYASDSCDVAAISMLVQEVPLPIINYEYSPKYIDSEVPVVNFRDISQNQASSQWFFGDGEKISGTAVTHYFDIYADSANTVTLVSSNELGCSEDTTFSIPIEIFGFYKPNVFTPAKNENNVFKIVTANHYDSFHISIFNRQGLLVFSSDDVNFEWDGTKDGVLLPQGAYAYVITYTRSGSTAEQAVKGIVTLIR